MRRISSHQIDIIDAEFRVIGRSRWAGWMAQFPSKRDRFAFVCSVIAPLAVLGGVLLGFFHFAFLAAVLIVTVGCLVSTEWQRYGVLGLVVASLLATSGCSQEATPEPQRATLASDRQAKLPEEVRASIRRATKYRDPRKGVTPMGIDILSGEVKANDEKDTTHEAR
ncbi:hypothetical protein [Lysobacter auxotrophicus]|uniref:DUF2628 domain-containing protein n=1 Tax=Lysobacter auxotrophicus TaxID=2992573 RepID=A0ABN6UGF6_9GAMM|nr:hypothetical protein [Lysobacter auxotrophicus]BDU15384.1 hypothetical protein LA521A_05850 [Lysobacter auxotrophicus]